ncbi:hypothetical protein JCM8097_003762, partial [Rhodosporidiobolus ruineniae]
MDHFNPFAGLGTTAPMTGAAPAPATPAQRQPSEGPTIFTLPGLVPRPQQQPAPPPPPAFQPLAPAPAPAPAHSAVGLAHAPAVASTLRTSVVAPPSSPAGPSTAPSTSFRPPPGTPSRPSAPVAGLEVTTLTPSSRSNPKSSTTPRRVGPGGVPFLPAFSPRDTLCAFCGGDASVNKHGRGEEMVSCYECGSSGHPTCLEWDDWGMVKRVKGYAWLCQECKRCEVCDEKGDD